VIPAAFGPVGSPGCCRSQRASLEACRSVRLQKCGLAHLVSARVRQIFALNETTGPRPQRVVDNFVGNVFGEVAAHVAGRSPLLLRVDIICKFGLGRDGQMQTGAAQQTSPSLSQEEAPGRYMSLFFSSGEKMGSFPALLV
jgi:hypothetical protein